MNEWMVGSDRGWCTTVVLLMKTTNEYAEYCMHLNIFSQYSENEYKREPATASSTNGMSYKWQMKCLQTKRGKLSNFIEMEWSLVCVNVLMVLKWNSSHYRSLRSYPVQRLNKIYCECESLENRYFLSSSFLLSNQFYYVSWLS